MVTKTEKQSTLGVMEGVRTTEDTRNIDKTVTGRRSKALATGIMVGREFKVFPLDGLNICIARRRRSKEPGKESWEITGYYSTYKAALQSLVDVVTRDSDLADLRSVVAKIDELKADITVSLSHHIQS